MHHGLVSVLLLALAFPMQSSAGGFTARLRLRGPSDGALLERLDISVDSIRGLEARIWIDEKEEQALVAAGLTVTRTVDGAFLQRTATGLAAGYHTPESCEAHLKDLAKAHPEICRYEEIGKSVKGRAIASLYMGTGPGKHAFRPMARICGAHHGNEIASAEVVIMFIDYLVEHRSDERIARLLETTEISLTPMVNPDGVAKRTRYNANYTDLNRNYGYHFGRSGKAGSSAFSEPESRAIRDQAMKLPFSVSLSFHNSGDIVNYLWNYTTTRCLDQDLILELSEGYASFNGYEVTEGADWYRITGDTNDWSYGCAGDLDTTIEIANPSYDKMQGVFERNLESMLYTVEASRRGICGIVSDEATGAPLEAMVEAIPPRWPAFTHAKLGDYHRILQPGTYKLRVWAPGYEEKIIDAIQVGAGEATRVDVALKAKPGRYHAMRILEATFPRDDRNTTHGPHALGPADGVFCSLGRGGAVLLDLSDAFGTAASAELRIVDAAGADDEAESWTLESSDSCDGPWSELGKGKGTATLAVKNLKRFLRVVGDGTKDEVYRGSTTPGLDLDAVTVTLPVARQSEGFRRLHGE